MWIWFLYLVFCNNHDMVSPYTPPSNDVAKLNNRTLKELTSALLLDSGAPSIIWGEAPPTACCVMNRVPYKKTYVTFFELLKIEKEL